LSEWALKLLEVSPLPNLAVTGSIPAGVTNQINRLRQLIFHSDSSSDAGADIAKEGLSVRFQRES
jgi:hypothetical protein